ncbi:MAG: aldehyde dehydrogenase (NADP(+)) [Bacteroidota bacterium]
MELTGAQFIGNTRSKEGTALFDSISPASNQPNGGVSMAEATPSEIDEAVELAEQAFDEYRQIGKDERASLLERIADNIEELGATLINECMAETALPEARLIGERGRTMNQLRLFAQVVRDGNWVDARIDTPIPDRQPLPKPDVRSMAIPLGPIAVFGASNFPLAFSVAGGDTASALAAGCPVVFKAHPAHPRTCELVAGAIVKALSESAMPEGVFSMVHGKSHEVGGQLVTHPKIRAVAFTGSQAGGLALFRQANARKTPIPVFAEMGSTNPVFILPEALKNHSEKLVQGLAGSVNLGVGQFCTNPGLIFTTSHSQTEPFINDLSSAMQSQASGTMLTSGIAAGYRQGTSALAATEGVEAIANSSAAAGDNDVDAHLFRTDVTSYLQSKTIQEEVFGPSTVLIQGGSREEILEAARSLEGQLTATIHGTTKDLESYEDLMGILEQKVGRLIINGYPTGVEVCHSMVHGGPFPATTAPATTSVGTAAIHRFVRPVCYQDFPQRLLPAPLQDDNPWGIYRLVNGELTKASIK